MFLEAAFRSSKTVGTVVIIDLYGTFVDRVTFLGILGGMGGPLFGSLSL